MCQGSEINKSVAIFKLLQVTQINQRVCYLEIGVRFSLSDSVNYCYLNAIFWPKKKRGSYTRIVDHVHTSSLMALWPSFDFRD